MGSYTKGPVGQRGKLLLGTQVWPYYGEFSNNQEMCIIRGKNGYFVFYVVKNWLLCSISCQKLAKYVLFVKVYCRRLVMVGVG